MVLRVSYEPWKRKSEILAAGLIDKNQNTIWLSPYGSEADMRLVILMLMLFFAFQPFGMAASLECDCDIYAMHTNKNMRLCQFVFLQIV